MRCAMRWTPACVYDLFVLGRIEKRRCPTGLAFCVSRRRPTPNLAPGSMIRRQQRAAQLQTRSETGFFTGFQRFTYSFLTFYRYTDA